jgi:hypothetical protein
MNHEQVITEADLRTRFRNERDVVTLSPYHVGDRVVRCSSCRTIIKSEFVSDGCPICGHAPFIPAPVDIKFTEENQRSPSSFFWRLLLSAAAAWLPFAFSNLSELIGKATSRFGIHNSMLYVGVVGLIAALITYCNRQGRRTWMNGGGDSLLLIPVLAPYLLLAAIWGMIHVIPIMSVISIVGLVIGFVLLFID